MSLRADGDQPTARTRGQTDVHEAITGGDRCHGLRRTHPQSMAAQVLYGPTAEPAIVACQQRTVGQVDNLCRSSRFRGEPVPSHPTSGRCATPSGRNARSRSSDRPDSNSTRPGQERRSGLLAQHPAIDGLALFTLGQSDRGPGPDRG